MTDLRIVLCFLGLGLLLSLGLCGWLAMEQLPIPDVLVAVSTGSLGALGGILVKSSGEARP